MRTSILKDLSSPKFGKQFKLNRDLDMCKSFMVIKDGQIKQITGAFKKGIWVNCVSCGTFSLSQDEKAKKHPILSEKVHITVKGGVAEVTKCPRHIEVIITDLDGDA